jgi:hypothetical protein
MSARSSYDMIDNFFLAGQTLTIVIQLEMDLDKKREERRQC